jgi:hypothetical protein
LASCFNSFFSSLVSSSCACRGALANTKTARKKKVRILIVCLGLSEVNELVINQYHGDNSCGCRFARNLRTILVDGNCENCVFSHYVRYSWAFSLLALRPDLQIGSPVLIANRITAFLTIKVAGLV